MARGKQQWFDSADRQASKMGALTHWTAQRREQQRPAAHSCPKGQFFLPFTSGRADAKSLY
jgi:hypothetical protein